MIKSLFSILLIAFFLPSYGQRVLVGKFEAESFIAKQGVSTEITADTDGGMDVGWIADNGWMDYAVQAPVAGYYTFNFRLANGFSDNATLQLRAANGTVFAQILVPRTGGMQSWKTVGVTALLPAGTQTLRLFALKGVFSINWFNVRGPKALPGRIQAEDYDAINDVRPETTLDIDGGQDMGNIDDGDWLDFNVNLATAGTYTVNFRVANNYGNGLIEFRNSAGATLGQVGIPRTYGWQNWTTVSLTTNLSAGNQLLRIVAVRGAFNFNWFEVVRPAPPLPKPVLTFADLAAKTAGDASFNLAATSTNTQTPITFTSSNPQIVSVSNTNGVWKATPLAVGSATITASQVASTTYAAADNVTRTQVVQAVPSVVLGSKITLDPKRWYQLTNATYGLDQLFDGVTNVNVLTGWGKVLDNYDAYYPLLNGEKMTLESIKFFDFEGIFKDKPMTLSVITDTWQRIPIATFTGEIYNGWVGPYPGRTLAGNALFKLDASVSNIRYLVLTIQSGMPTEMELYGSYTPPTAVATPIPKKAIKLRDMFGVNAFEWNFEDGNSPWQINEPKMNMVKSFAGIRHYMDWSKLESAPGVYSYNPTISGGWDYDAMYQRCKDANIDVLACLKTLPTYMVDTYPTDQRDYENVPVRYGKDFANPLSYIEQAKVGFQYAARYGRNTAVNPALLSVNQTPRWTNDRVNTIKIGLGLIKYIECDNERDKWWKGRKGYQTAREYAANLSAFYDGHKNTMGPGVGVRNADPTMKVVIAGLVSGPEYVRAMIDWCREFRGYKPDGTVNLCWDIINFHIYVTDDASLSQTGSATRGAAPEVTTDNLRLTSFVQMAHDYAYDMPVWITEAGYDVAQTSPLKAIPIGTKTALQTQGDWILRMCLFSARLGIEKLFYYEMYDDNSAGGRFGSSGLVESSPTLARRPAADYMYQTAKLFGDYVYKETINKDPIVDRYEANGKSVYAIVVPDEKGRTAPYTLSLPTGSTARIYRPKSGADDMAVEEVPISGGKITLTATETPLFVMAVPVSGAREATELPESAENPSLHTALTVYPNPASNSFTVTVNNKSLADLELTLFDANLGRLHKQLTIQKNDQIMSHSVDLSELPMGTYIIEFKQGMEREFRKLVKEN
ncbi:carbohydrate-binding protein [Spirosoma pollinicola]|uniref:Carbohydrate-binding protein n=1 Tax=Spirosoma pollinicola TaxID=2057025 RepID=A0A2K8YTD0_9BACT|nr:carbohydrate-binding protein [Spirosoma pollinicola]AUD00892.1 carbohydrate-binding protein [Spirosoma pollinicola]